MKVSDFSGNKCANRYQKEYINKYSDSLIFYIDGKLKFERYCFGEAACLVFDAWGTLCEDGTINYKFPLDDAVVVEALPKKITAVDGSTLYCDDDGRKWSHVMELAFDKLNGYSRTALFFKKLFR